MNEVQVEESHRRALEVARLHLTRAIEELEKAGIPRFPSTMRRIRHLMTREIAPGVIAEEATTTPHGQLLKPEVYGARLDPPRAAHRMTQLCRAGRIKGAVRPGNEWLV